MKTPKKLSKNNNAMEAVGHEIQAIGDQPLIVCGDWNCSLETMPAFRQVLTARGFVNAWQTMNQHSGADGFTCRACPTSIGTVRDYMYVSHHLVAGIKACNIDADALFQVHLPVRMWLTTPAKRDVVNYLKAPIDIEHVLDNACTDDMALVHKCMDAFLAESDYAMCACKRDGDAQGMWNIWSASVERGMLLVTGCPLEHPNYRGKGRVHTTSKVEGACTPSDAPADGAPDTTRTLKMLKAARTCYALASIIARHRPRSHAGWPTKALHMWCKIRECPTDYCLEHEWVDMVQIDAVSINAIVMHLKLASSRCNR